jgi:hypothetical protein
MNEEIQIGMGLNTSNFSQGMRSMRTVARETISEIKNTFINGFKEMFAPLLAGFAAGKLFESVKGIAEWGKQIKLLAGETGTSTEFIQGLQAASHKLGISAETSADSIGVLSRKIGEARAGSDEAQNAFKKWGIAIDGLSNEQVFYNIADAMKATADPAMRNAMAFELMGKASREMAVALPIGADGLKSLIESASKLSDAEVEKLDELDARLEEVGRKWHIIWGTIVASFVDQPGGPGMTESAIQARMQQIRPTYSPGAPMANESGASLDALREKAIAQLKEENKSKASAIALSEKDKALLAEADKIRKQNGLAELSTADKLNALLERQKQLKDASGITPTPQQVLDAAKIEKDIAETRKKLRKEADEQDKTAAKNLHELRVKNLEIEHAKHQQQFREDDLKIQEEQYKELTRAPRLTLHQLATSDFGFSGTLGQDQYIARQIELKEQQMNWNTMHGFYDDADSRSSEIEKLRHSLSANLSLSERDPYGGQRRALEKAEDQKKYDDLMLVLKQQGVVIIPSMA